MRLTILLLLALVAPSVPATAQSDLPLRDYVHTVWNQHDGMPLGAIGSVFQTDDNYLWLTTNAQGLLRFDGMRFVSVPTPCPRRRLTSAAPAADGGFWAVCDGQLLRRTTRGEFVVITQSFLRPLSAPSVHVDHRGRPWFLDGRSIRYLEPDGTGGREVALPTGLPITASVLDSEGALWVSDGRQIVRMHEGGSEKAPIQAVECLARAHDGGVFALTANRVWRLRAGSPPSVTSAPPGVAFTNVNHCMSDDGAGGVWIGTREHGLALLRKNRIETSLDSSRDDRFIGEVFVDREGTIWAGTITGLHRFRKPMVQVAVPGSTFTSVPAFVFVDSREALWTSPVERFSVTRIHPDAATPQLVQRQQNSFVAIGEDETGRVWLSNTVDIGYVNSGKFVAVHDAANASVSRVWSFTTDGRGQLWAMAEGVGVYRVAPGPPRLVVQSPGASGRFLVTERFGIWVAREDGGVEQHFDGRTNVFPDEDPTGRYGGMLRTILEDGDSIWTGSFLGLRRWRHGRWTAWTHEHGLPGNGNVQEMIADRSGHFWIMTRGGLMRVSRSQLDDTPDGSPRSLSFALIGRLDFVPHPGNMRPSPRATIDRHGRLFFTVMDSVVTVDPSAVTDSSLAPPIVLESVTIDNQAIDQAAPQTFVEPSRLQFDYTSLSLRSPETARFRYQLEGYDRDWIEAGAQRRVTYGTLRPGRYRFRVTGAGGEGVWNEAGAAFVFQIAPVFWRTWWFRMTLVALAAVIVAALYRLRVNQLTRQFNVGLEARVGERTRIARELHDTLLQTIQGSKMVADHALKDSADHTRAIRALAQLSTWLAQATEEGRTALHSLRASNTDTSDLASSLRLAISECRTNGGAEISMAEEGDSRTVDPVVRDDIYRIAYEAIRNACAHSGGDRIEVVLAYGPDLTVRIGDNGTGIEPQMIETGREGHFGLRGMRERAERIAGTLTVAGSSGSGTIVTLMVPGSRAYVTGRHNRV